MVLRTGMDSPVSAAWLTMLASTDGAVQRDHVAGADDDLVARFQGETLSDLATTPQ